MAASELRGELKYRDGQTKTFTIKTENSLKSIISSVKKLHSDISGVLTSLVEQERGVCDSGKADCDEEEADSDEQDDAAENASVQSNSSGPPAKRLKALMP